MPEIPHDGIIIYTTEDGLNHISLFARDGSVWLNQNQMAELFATSKQNISLHFNNVLADKELHKDSVVKDYLTTASDGKQNTKEGCLKKTNSSGFLNTCPALLATCQNFLQVHFQKEDGK